MVYKIERQLKLGIVDEAENGDLSFKRASYSAPKNCSSVLEVLIVLHISQEIEWYGMCI